MQFAVCKGPRKHPGGETEDVPDENHSMEQLEDLPSPGPQSMRKKYPQQNREVALRAAFDTTPYSSFADHIGSKLNTYDDYTRSQVEFQISKILYDADMIMLRAAHNNMVLETPSNYSAATTMASVKENVILPDMSRDYSPDCITTTYISGTSSNYNAECTIKTAFHSNTHVDNT